MKAAPRLLIIEDNRANLFLMSYLLRTFGCDIEHAKDGREGVELARTGRFDLVVSDVQLPGLDGYEIARQLKNAPATAQLPLVAVSALAMVGDREKILAAGFDCYISKPISPETFVHQIAVYLPADCEISEQPARAPHSGSADPERPEPKHRATIVAVDDQISNLNVLRSLLEPSGFRLLTARSGNEARVLLEDQRPDLVLAELHLGREPDWEFFDRFHADERFTRIPFFFISSAGARENLRQEALHRGATGFLFRPVEPPALLAAIEQSLRSADNHPLSSSD